LAKFAQSAIRDDDQPAEAEDGLRWSWRSPPGGTSAG
jgi:hypothetical protein